MDNSSITDVANNAIDKLDTRFGELLDKLGITAQYLWPKLCEYVVYRWWINFIEVTALLIISLFVLYIGFRKLNALKKIDSSYSMEFDGPPISFIAGCVLTCFFAVATAITFNQIWIIFNPEIAALQEVVALVK